MKEEFYKRAVTLALITIFYNLGEGVVSVWFGMEDEVLSLFGFGLDSFAEVISGMGIWHLVRRLRQNKDVHPDKFEQNALKITGMSFYILAAGLVGTAMASLYQGHAPETTFWGMAVALVSILSMGLLIHYKIKVGRQLDSQAILADANCTKTCMYLSVVLLVSSAGYELTGMGGIDSVGALIIAVISIKEGHESFQKAKGKACCCSEKESCG